MAARTVVCCKPSDMEMKRRQRDVILKEMNNGNIKTYNELTALKDIVLRRENAVQTAANTGMWWVLLIGMLTVVISFFVINMNLL
jgi:hypothetical protein